MRPGGQQTQRQKKYVGFSYPASAILLSQLLIDFKRGFGGHPPENYLEEAVSSMPKVPEGKLSQEPFHRMNPGFMQEDT